MKLNFNIFYFVLSTLFFSLQAANTFDSQITQNKYPFRQVVLWGNKPYSYIHSHIQRGFSKAFNYLGYKILWLDNNDDIGSIDFSNSLFIIEGHSDQKVPLRGDCYYVIHNCDENKYKEFIAQGKCLILQLYTQEVLKKEVEKLQEGIYWQHTIKTLYMSCENGLLANEIETTRVKFLEQSKNMMGLFVGRNMFNEDTNQLFSDVLNLVCITSLQDLTDKYSDINRVYWLLQCIERTKKILVDGSALQVHEVWWENNVLRQENTFSEWLEDENAPSRFASRNHIIEHKYVSILDIPSGLCTEAAGYIKDKSAIKYTGIDITPMLVTRGLRLGFDVRQGSIECIPCSDSIFDIVYSRHILEHLNYYEKAVSELIRVAHYETLIVFFIKPTAEEDRISSTMIDGALLYHNTYNKEKLERFVKSHSKVKEVVWEHVTDKEVLLHIYMKQEGCV